MEPTGKTLIVEPQTYRIISARGERTRTIWRPRILASGPPITTSNRQILLDLPDGRIALPDEQLIAFFTSHDHEPPRSRDVQGHATVCLYQRYSPVHSEGCMHVEGEVVPPENGLTCLIDVIINDYALGIACPVKKALLGPNVKTEDAHLYRTR